MLVGGDGDGEEEEQEEGGEEEDSITRGLSSKTKSLISDEHKISYQTGKKGKGN
jgi:hypothetical protein